MLARKPHTRVNRQGSSFLPFFSLIIAITAPMTHGAGLSMNILPANAKGAAIQAALDQMTTGGEVVLLAGTYEISEPLIMRNDRVTLRGSGTATILHLAEGANCPVIVMGAPDQAEKRTTSHLRVADLMIDGNRLKQTQELWKLAMDGSVLNNNGIDIWEVSDAEVEKVICKSCRSGGLVMAQARRVAVKGYTAYDNHFDGLACYQTEDCSFTGLVLRDNQAAGISLDLSFQRNLISDARLTGNDLGIFMRDSRDNIFRSVTIDRSRNHGIFVAQTGNSTQTGWKLIEGTQCTGNKFEEPMITNSGGCAILINDVACTNNVVHDATYAGNARGDFVQAGQDTTAGLNLQVP